MSIQINQLTRVAPNSGQTVPVYDPTVGDARSWSLSDLLAWLQTNFVSPAAGRPEPDTQYAAPSASAFTVQITDDDKDVHLILTPTAGFAAGTIKLPNVTNIRDKQLVIVNCTQAITTLTIDGNGAVAVTGAPTTLAANAYFTLKYDITVQTWYRIC